jgi:hypothetical protein
MRRFMRIRSAANHRRSSRCEKRHCYYDGDSPGEESIGGVAKMNFIAVNDVPLSSQPTS